LHGIDRQRQHLLTSVEGSLPQHRLGEQQPAAPFGWLATEYAGTSTKPASSRMADTVYSLMEQLSEIRLESGRDLDTAEVHAILVGNTV
jgi:hypothetical protein